MSCRNFCRNRARPRGGNLRAIAAAPEISTSLYSSAICAHSHSITQLWKKIKFAHNSALAECLQSSSRTMFKTSKMSRSSSVSATGNSSLMAYSIEI